MREEVQQELEGMSKMAYNDSTTIGEIFALSAKVLTENDVFNLGKRRLAKVFLRELLDLDVGVADAELETAYKACSPKESIPEDSTKFWSFIEKEYLHLEAEPKEKFTEICFRVNEDLIALENNLSYIKKELTSLEEKKKTDGRLTADERYYRNQLEYFEKKNLVAKNEIVDFMTHQIKRYAISKASVKNPLIGFHMSLFGDSPYAFGRRFHWALADPYDVRSLDSYSNKFMDLPVGGHREMVKECKSSPEKFKECSTFYINGIPGELPSVREKLLELVGKSHILFSRKNVIETMLRHYEAKDYISLVSMAPLQIEGIFADICREIGVSESQLDISSLNDKLQHIDDKMRSFFYFEYYSFKFPVLRNLVAHGGLVDGDLEETAIHLMLDLLPVCELAVSEDLPIIHALDVLKDASNGKSKQLVEWLDLRKSVNIPDFYGVQDSIARAEAYYATQEFWDYLEGELKKVTDVDLIKNSEPVKVAGKVKSAGLADEQAEKFLKTSWRVATEAINQRNEMREKLRNLLKPKMDIPEEEKE
ncbi:hypothetical protein AQ836_18450 [Burkholderia pseudomallei]|nr:hypothetical protein AQ821_14350 [Burkholderia pseudomallei]OMY03594.1 hypothetical protein AQ836_18450 [Burkholderia pseudomallei]OMY80557.1 hypothetical protein AQ851_13455 [Burkholderia pseudomallei]